jgi:hypothetical protein
MTGAPAGACWRERAALAAIAGAGGLGVTLALIGWRGLDPLDLSWLRGDAAAQYLGWAFYRRESGWHLPLAWTTRLGHPAGTSIALLDSIPLLAALLRPLSPLLPDPFQYLGLFAAGSLALQAYFGMRLCQRMCGNDRVFTVVGGLLFLVSPAVTWRVFGHFALASHWLLVASLACYVRPTAGMAPRRWLAPFALIAVIGGGIHPYLAVLCLVIGVAAAARLGLEHRYGWGRALLASAGLAALTAGSMALFGFAPGLDRESYAAPGWGHFSLNLLAPINPMREGSLFLPALPLATPGQYEGYSYLGFGIIALLVANLLRAPRVVRGLATTLAVPLVALSVVCTLAALSSTITLGSHTLLHVPLPRPLVFVAESFRASGRLFWPVHYLLVLAAVVLTYQLWRSPWRESLLVLALLLQVADEWGQSRVSKAHFDRPVVSPLRSERWQTLGADHERLVVIPAALCPGALGGAEGFAVFGQLAAAQGLATNTYAPARVGERAFQVHCVDIPAGVRRGQLDARAAYVVDDQTRAALDGATISSHRCAAVDGFNLCTRR